MGLSPNKSIVSWKYPELKIHLCSVAQGCQTLFDPTDCSPPGSSVHAIFQTRVLEQVAISYSRGSSQPRDQTCVSCICCISRQILYHGAAWEAPILHLILAKRPSSEMRLVHQTSWASQFSPVYLKHSQTLKLADRWASHQTQSLLYNKEVNFSLHRLATVLKERNGTVV